MTTLTVELPENIFATLRRSPQEVALDLRLAAAIDWYQRQMISQGRAAEIAGLSRADFIDALASRNIEVIQVDFETLDQEIDIV